jgi:hypothetical protein
MSDGTCNPNLPTDCRAWSTIEFTQTDEFWRKIEELAERGEPFVADPVRKEVNQPIP